MIVLSKCKFCNEAFVIDIGDLNKEDADQLIKELYPKGFGCCKEAKSVNDFLIDWNKNIIDTKESDDIFKLRLEKQFGTAYTLDELKEKFDIKSDAFGAILVSHKQYDDLILFNKIVSQNGTNYFYSSDVIMNK